MVWHLHHVFLLKYCNPLDMNVFMSECGCRYAHFEAPVHFHELYLTSRVLYCDKNVTIIRHVPFIDWLNIRWHWLKCWMWQEERKTHQNKCFTHAQHDAQSLGKIVVCEIRNRLINAVSGCHRVSYISFLCGQASNWSKNLKTSDWSKLCMWQIVTFDSESSIQ